MDNAGSTPDRSGITGPAGVTVVIPTVGRPCLAATLGALAVAGPPPVPAELLVVDDRPRPGGGPPAGPTGAVEGSAEDLAAKLDLPELPGLPVRVLAGAGAGPAAARNLGWRAARFPWVAFLDDDVIPDPDWVTALVADLAVPERVGGVQGRVRVPLPAHRRPTDWERSTAGLASADWITADMAYRRAALHAVGGFDERFPRAYREDAELAYRVRRAGWRLVRGRRAVTHPVRPEGPWISLKVQRGNADDALLRRRYGRHWRDLLAVPAGRRARHAAVTAAGLAALVAACLPRRRIVASVTFLAWAAGTAEFAAARIAPGPRSLREVSVMAATSVVIPPLACYHWLRGWFGSGRYRPPGGRR